MFCEGYALNCTVASAAMKKSIQGAKIAVLDFNLQKMKLQQGIAVKLTDPTKLEDIRRRESDVVKERIKLILNAGANVVLCSKGIDDQNMKVCAFTGHAWQHTQGTCVCALNCGVKMNKG